MSTTELVEETLETVDPQRRCPVCGGDASLRHDPLTSRWAWTLEPLRYRQGLVIRRCGRCDHSWQELPLNHEPITRDEYVAALQDHQRRNWSGRGLLR